MNPHLKKAFHAAEQLPDAAQETIASLILEEIKSVRRWDDLLSSAPDKLGRLVDMARKEVAEGGALPYDPSDRPTE